MSHPAASIKSIISGKTNLEPVTDMDPFFQLGFYSNFSDDGSSEQNYNHDDESVSNYSVTSKNLRTNNTTRQFVDRDHLFNANSSTNVSLASSGSEPQQQRLDPSSPTFAGATLDVTSRPVSRNSTTSCLSTTATKDGIEGKKLPRTGPSPYSYHVIANMMASHQDLDGPVHVHQGETVGQIRERANIKPGKKAEKMDIDDDQTNYSQASVMSTTAQINGDSGHKEAVAFEDLRKEPPVTLKEKLKLLEKR